MSHTEAKNRPMRPWVMVSIILVLAIVVGLGILAALNRSSPTSTDTSAARERLYTSCLEAHTSAKPEIGQAILARTCTEWTNQTFTRREGDVMACDGLSQTADEFVICLLGRMIQPSVGWQ